MCRSFAGLLAFWYDEEGGQTVEWVIIAALLAAMLITVIGTATVPEGSLYEAMLNTMVFIADKIPGG